jgi:hypothetical protein
VLLRRRGIEAAQIHIRPSRKPEVKQPMKTAFLLIAMMISTNFFAQDGQLGPAAAAAPIPGKLRVFVVGNNPVAGVVRGELRKSTAREEKKPNPNSRDCMLLVSNPKDADAIFTVDSVPRNSLGSTTDYISSAQLTSTDGTLLWSESIGDGSNYEDRLLGGDPWTSAKRLVADITRSRKPCDAARRIRPTSERGVTSK